MSRYEWEERKPPGRAVIEYVKNGGGVRRRAELVSGPDGNRRTVLLRTKAGDRLEIANRGPDVVTIDGEDERTEIHCGEAWNVVERQPFGSLGAGQSERWICGDETVTVTLRTECFAGSRAEYLTEAGRGGEGRGSIAEAAFRRVVQEARGTAAKRETEGEVLCDVELGTQAGVWAVAGVGSETWFRTDGFYDAASGDRPLRETVEAAARHLERDSRAGATTVLVLMNFRLDAPHAIAEDEVAEVLFGDAVNGTRGDEARNARKSGPADPELLKNVSAIATVSVRDMIPKQPERGIPGSRVARNTQVLYTTRMYRNPGAAVRAERDAFGKLRTAWNVRRRGRARERYRIANEVVQDWGWGWGVESVAEREPARRPGITGRLIRERRTGYEDRNDLVSEGIEEHDRDGPDRCGIRSKRRTFELTMTPPETRGLWVQYVYERSATDRTARIAGCSATVAGVLERLAAGESVAEVGRTTVVAPGGKKLRDERAAVKIAAEWASELAGEKETRPGEGDGVQLTADTCFGKPRLAGTRIRVGETLDDLAWGAEIEKTAESAATNPEGVLTSIRYGLRAVRKQESRKWDYVP